MRWLAIPLTAAVLGAGVVAWSFEEERTLQRGLEQVLHAHVDSVVQLVSEGVRQTTDAMDMVASLREAQLRALALLPPEQRSDQGAELLALLEEEDGGRLALRQGRLADAERLRLQEALAHDDPASMDLTASSASCLVDGQAPRRRVSCWDDRELQRLRRRAGLGPLLRGLAGRGTSYVAIQDESGLLASSPTPHPLSAWDQDPELEQARAGAFRVRDVPSDPGSLVEALAPYPLPDGTTALLRVGVDAEPVHAALGSASRRHQALLAIVATLVAASWIAALGLRRRDRRLVAYEHWARTQQQHQLHWERVGRLAAEVAHEVRNPLSTVQMVGQRLAREFQVPEGDRAEYAELLDLLGKEGARVEGVVGDFLDLARPLELEIRQVELPALLAEIAAPLRLRAAAEGKHLVLDVPDGATAHADARRLFQIVTNLAGNGLDAVAAGGTVRLRVCPSDGTELCIEDDGPGMSAERLERIQRPFETSKARGTGLGLALTRRFVEAHGGTLTLESAPGRGTRARVWLPSPTTSRKGPR